MMNYYVHSKWKDNPGRLKGVQRMRLAPGGHDGTDRATSSVSSVHGFPFFFFQSFGTPFSQSCLGRMIQSETREARDYSHSGSRR